MLFSNLIFPSPPRISSLVSFYRNSNPLFSSPLLSFSPISPPRLFLFLSPSLSLSYSLLLSLSRPLSLLLCYFLCVFLTSYLSISSEDYGGDVRPYPWPYSEGCHRFLLHVVSGSGPCTDPSVSLHACMSLTSGSKLPSHPWRPPVG